MNAQTVKHGIVYVLAAFGVLSILAIIIAAILLLIYKPLGIEVQNIPATLIKAQTGTPTSTYDHPLLTTEQESTLESLGVNTKALPTSLTPAQIACFTDKLSSARVQAIENGSPVTASDYFKAQNCLK